MSRNFYIAVTQHVLLFRAETWVLTKRMEAALDAFQGRVAWRLTGSMPRRGRDGKWLYPPLAGATKEAGIVRARTSFLQRQNTVAQFIATQPILGICEGTERRVGDTGPPTMVGTTRYRLEAGAGTEGKSGGSGGRRHQDWDRERERGRRRHWGPVAPVGRNGAGRRIQAHSFRRPEIHG